MRQGEVSSVRLALRGDFTNLSERKLMDCLNRLGYDIEIKGRQWCTTIHWGQVLSFVILVDDFLAWQKTRPDPFYW